MRPWLIRITVLAISGAVLWLFGPRAYEVLSKQFAGPVVSVNLDHVALRGSPDWLRKNPALVTSVLSELSPVLQGHVRQDDELGLLKIVEALQDLSWVASAGLKPAHPDRLRLALELRRPVLEVVPSGRVAGQVPVVFVSADGVCMQRDPAVESSGLPICRLMDGVLPGSIPVYELGKEHPDRRVLAAAKTALEWRDQICVQLPSAPELAEVDASNLGYRLVADSSYCEICVVLRRQSGGTAVFGYGREPGSPFLRVAVEDKAQVLGKILARYPGLKGVDKGDLRFVNLWENWLRPRSSLDSASATPK